MMSNILKAFIYIPCLFAGAVLTIDGLLPTKSHAPNPNILEAFIGLVLFISGLYLRRTVPKEKTYKEIKEEKS